ncbi:uncharacterized protein BO80DRAFT_429469 [Aspergillus ibericus CBS 121593]|uniref:F-box domain-containing protein n=1 Tax=Aspergillus ibericus CBS 121593 TaxID=1448316 RepID=A0A395GPK6_9EURO|nr:hypothetical protein BO80DRAFT_429469 [Aspergillus ibericus CBS 121593]RAK95963.1 hypothetical protein BO80DRAFT_429469 [Aspergillus ibericus CBS 121593]
METPDRCYLSALPAEIISHLFTSLPALVDVLNFAATCSRHQQIWQQNANWIYRQVGPRSIECPPYARVFLADQGGPHPKATLTARDVVQLVRNAAAAERSVNLFDQKFVACLQTRAYLRSRHHQFFGPPPTQLSPSERHRLTRAIYQLSGLVLLHPDARENRMASLKLKDVMAIIELANGYDDIYEVLMTVKAEPLLLETIAFRLHDFRDRIVAELLHDPHRIRGFPPEMGWRGCISLWDTFYEDFKEMVTVTGKGRVHAPIDEVWYDTSDEDAMD